MTLIFAMNRQDVEARTGLTRRLRLGVGMRLMVSGINHHRPTGLQAVSQGQSRVIEIARQNMGLPNIEGPLDEVVIANGGAELLEGDREIGVLHLPREGLL